MKTPSFNAPSFIMLTLMAATIGLSSGTVMGKEHKDRGRGHSDKNDYHHDHDEHNHGAHHDDHDDKHGAHHDDHDDKHGAHHDDDDYKHSKSKTALIESFYDLLTSPGEVTDENVNAVVAKNWVTIPAPEGPTGAAALVTRLQGLGKIVPDLKWEVEDILRDGNRYIVRGKATGTPVGPFLGIPANGKSFEISSIDIHTVKKGKIIHSYHVEDWATAMQQLSSN